MYSMKMFRMVLMAVAVLAFASGCATTGGGSKEATKPLNAGFLSDYSKLQVDPENDKVKRFAKQKDELKKYNKVLLERIMVVLKEDADYKGIDPDAMKAMTDYFREAITKELGTEYPLVNEPGPDVLRVRIAITDLVPTKTAVTVLVLVTPYATVADLASGAASKSGVGSAPYLGHAGIEAEGMDTVTNEQVFAYIEQRYGKKYDPEKPTQYFKAYSEWGYVKDAFDYWAKRLKAGLDNAHGKKPAK